MESIILLCDQWPAIELLSNEERGKLFQALFALGGACEMPEDLSTTAQAIFLLMRPRINGELLRNEAMRERNRINGRKGGRGRKAETRREEESVVATEKTESEKSDRFLNATGGEGGHDAPYIKDRGNAAAVVAETQKSDRFFPETQKTDRFFGESEKTDRFSGDESEKTDRFSGEETQKSDRFFSETQKTDRFFCKTQKSDRFLSPNGGEADEAQQPDRSLVSGSGYNIINYNINKKEKIHPPFPPQQGERRERQGVGGEGISFRERKETPFRRVQDNGQPLPVTQRTEAPFAEDPGTRGDMGFQQLVDAYPVGHVGSLEEARRVWERMRQRRELPGLPRLLGGVAIWQDSDQWNRDGGRYINRLANFLRNRMWEVAPPAPEKLIHDDWEERAARERKAEIARGVRILEAYERQKQRREAVQLAMAQ